VGGIKRGCVVIEWSQLLLLALKENWVIMGDYILIAIEDCTMKQETQKMVGIRRLNKI